MIALDPALQGDFGWQNLAIVGIKVLTVFVAGLLATMLMVWFERKVVAGMQNRVGPNKAGPFGLLQTLADGIKLFFKEDVIPSRADRFVFALAPFLSFVPAFLAFAIIPLGGDWRDGNDGLVTWFGVETRVQLADPHVGVLFALAISSIAVQMVSYEAALGLSLASVLLTAGTLSTSGIVAAQSTLGTWHVVTTGVVPFVIFLIAATAELNRPPFDLVEAEQELVGGFNTEYSSLRFSLFFLAEFMNTVTMSALIVTLFFGGPQPIAINGYVLDIPFVPNALEGTIWLVLKVLVFLYAYVWFRASLPRLRYDQLMDFGWKVLIPASLGWFLLLAAQRLARSEGWSVITTTVIAVVVLAGCYAMLSLAFATSARTRAREGAQF